MAGEKIYAPDNDKLAEIMGRRTGHRYAMFMGPEGRPAYRELTTQQELQRNQEERDHAKNNGLPDPFPDTKPPEPDRNPPIDPPLPPGSNPR